MIGNVSLVETVDSIGYASAMVLITAFAGRALYIPLFNSGRKSETRDILFGIMGEEKATKLMVDHGRKMLYVPNGYSEIRRERNKQIVKEYDGSETLAELVLKHGLSNRRIRDILKMNGVNPGKIKKAEILSRNEKVAELYNGESIQAFADKVGLSTCVVTNVLRKTGKIPPL